MKYLKFTLFILLNMGLFLSCSSDDDNGNENGNNSEFFLRATINGIENDYSVQGEVACRYLLENETMYIASSNPDGTRLITLGAVNFSGEGSYPIGTSGDQYAIAQYIIGNAIYSNIYTDPYGSIVITNYDEANGTIEGSFTFNASSPEGEEIQVTDGAFKCKNSALIEEN